MRDIYDPEDHYWLVAGKIFSSLINKFVAAVPKNFIGTPTKIASEAELSDVIYQALGWRPTFGDMALIGAEVRAQRKKMISACDWTRLDDVPLTVAQKAAWATYRQALRDVTAQAGFPANVAWPPVPV